MERSGANTCRPQVRFPGYTMSYDIYLLPLQTTDDFDSAMSLLSGLDEKPMVVEGPIDARDAASAVSEMDQRYKPFERDYAAIARYEKISEEDARKRYDWVELNGTSESGKPLAQFVFNRTHVVIHWYSGTTSEELENFLQAICSVTGFAAVDPQEGTVSWLREDGTLA